MCMTVCVIVCCCCCVSRMQEERQERRKLKHAVGLVDEDGNKLPIDPTDDDIGIIGPKSLGQYSPDSVLSKYTFIA